MASKWQLSTTAHNLPYRQTILHPVGYSVRASGASLACQAIDCPLLLHLSHVIYKNGVIVSVSIMSTSKSIKENLYY